MAADLKKSLNDLKKLYGGLGASRKLIIAGVVAIALSGFTYLILFGQQMDFDYLFTNLADEDAGQIVQILKDKQIEYVLEDNAIKAPREQVYELRMLLAAEGLPSGKGVGFEIFDSQKLGTSQFVQDLNLSRALQGELSRTISQLDKIEVARVHLVMPKKTLFKEDQTEPSASVVVKLKVGKTLEKSEVKSIIHLVASAVEGLDARSITVIDSNGTMLSQAAGDEAQIWGSSPLEYKAKVESELARNVEEIISRVVGLGKVVAKVTVELDFKKEEKTEELFDPDQVVVRSEKRTKENRANSEPAPGGAPGTASNTPAGPQAGNNQNSKAEAERDLINYEINKVVRHTIRAAGDMKRLSVAVLVDGTYSIEEENGQKVQKYHPRSDAQLAQIADLAKKAVGFDQERGDAVAVTSVAFETSAMSDEDLNFSFMDRYDFILPTLRYMVIFVVALLAVFVLFRPLIGWVIRFHEEERLREIEVQQEDVVKSMEEQLLEVRKTIEVSTVEYKKQLQDLAAKAPDLVVAVIRQWVNAED
ncbi:MAG: flagellar M-ring protein FliF [Myxococcales bacterium]|nr:MAG: flagellar M-ring protein FliF [Myxococcales bacterium]